MIIPRYHFLVHVLARFHQGGLASPLPPPQSKAKEKKKGGERGGMERETRKSMYVLGAEIRL